jgi:hypothetical protein
MHLLDFVICAIVLGGVAIGSARRLGRSAFDLAALLLALRFSTELAGYTGSWLGLADAPASLLTFAIVAGILLVGGHYLYLSTQWEFGPMDQVAGATFGLASGLIIAHVFVVILMLHTNPGGGAPESVMASTLALEVTTFKTYHQVLHTLYNIGA